jgi:hypothetical protein
LKQAATTRQLEYEAQEKRGIHAIQQNKGAKGKGRCLFVDIKFDQE